MFGNPDESVGAAIKARKSNLLIVNQRESIDSFAIKLMCMELWL